MNFDDAAELAMSGNWTVHRETCWEMRLETFEEVDTATVGAAYEAYSEMDFAIDTDRYWAGATFWAVDEATHTATRGATYDATREARDEL